MRQFCLSISAAAMMMWSYTPAFAGEPSPVSFELEAPVSARMTLLVAIDEAVGALKSRYPQQLALWDTSASKQPMSCEGKRYLSSGRRLVYYHAMLLDLCRPEPTTFEQATCLIDVRVYTKAEMRQLEGPNIYTKLFGLDVGDHKIVADVWTNNPEAPALETQIINIIKAAAKEAGEPSHNNQVVPHG